MSRLMDLLTTIERLRGQHRAGLVPSHGEVEALFDAAADVRGDIALGHLYEHASTPPTIQAPSTARQGFLSVESVDAAGRVVSRARIPLEPIAAAGGGDVR